VTARNFKPFVAKIQVTVGAHVTLTARLSVTADHAEV
jgi:hypothetical protein